VIARAAGGALDSVDPDRSGVLVSSDRVDDWAAALAEFADPADSEARRRFALQFGRDSFVDQINRVVGTS
jgi:glycosyltransferase involved in cell wall biosynthesis